MSSFSTVLFDLDGTLIDHFAAIHRCYAYTMPQLGLPEPTMAETRAAIGGGIEDAMSRFVPRDRIPEAIKIYRAFWDQTMLQGVSLMPGARELLEKLHDAGVTLAVLTNKLGSSSRLICDHLGLTPFLKHVYGAKDTEWLKPDAALSAYVLSDLGATAGTSLMVGDSPYDVLAAHAGAFPCWAVTTGTHRAVELHEAGADAIFDNLIDLAAAFPTPR